uniref:hypothetical protein n=1 Tax=Comamonas testosteroni TaxID=285 RepID=UPI001E48EFD4|nr:hypothetical protein [Comamonas testosteroni]
MKQPIKMTPGDELHLTALMAPFSLNLVTGQDRQHLLGYGRAAFVAGHAQLRASTPEAAEDLIEEIIERISDHAVKAMAHQEARKQGNLEQIESARQAIFQAEDCIKRDLRTLASWTDTASAEAEQAAWHAGLDEGRAQAAPAAVAVPDERAAFEAWAKSEDMSIGSDCDGYIHSNTAAASLAWQARAALAATPAAEQIALTITNNFRDAGWSMPSIDEARVLEAVKSALSTSPAAVPVVLTEPAPTPCRSMFATQREYADAMALHRKNWAEVEAERALLATATELPAQAVEQVPVLYVSKGQLDNHRDPDGPESFNAGRYLPARITPAGKFTTPLFAAPQAQADARDAAFEAVRKAFCKLQRYSFFLDDKGNVRRTPDYCGNWVEFEAVHMLFEPAAVDAAIDRAAIAAANGEQQS